MRRIGREEDVVNVTVFRVFNTGRGGIGMDRRDDRVESLPMMMEEVI